MYPLRREIPEYVGSKILHERERMLVQLNGRTLRSAQPSDEYGADWVREEYDCDGGVDVFRLEHMASSLPRGPWKALANEFELEYQDNGEALLYVPHAHYLRSIGRLRYDLPCLVQVIGSMIAIIVLLYLVWFISSSAGAIG